jgi:hypothetical protein
MSNLKRNLTIPYTNARLAQSIDFAGYIYPQFFTTTGFNLLSTTSTGLPPLPGTVGSQVSAGIKTTKAAMLNNFLNPKTGSVLGGIRKFGKTYARDVNKRMKMGNYEAFQCIPGEIGISLTLDKVVFYDTLNQFDKLLDINYDGGIKQSAPIMIVENLESPSGDVKTIMFLDCWIKGSKIDYNLQENVMVVNSLTVECARAFVPSDVSGQDLSLLFQNIGLIENALNFNFNVGSTL